VRILLTGSTGFVGSAFLRLAVERGHEVAALVRPSRTLPTDVASARNIRWLRGTLAEAPWPEITSFAPEVCAHAAWISTPGVYLESPENHRFVEWSLDFLRRALDAGTKHLVVLGTCIEYEIGPAPLGEDRTPIAPSTTYARCKHELHLRLEQELAGRPVALSWPRLFTLYGPGEHPARLCTSIIQRLRRDQPVTLRTPDTTRDYIYIDDVARALLFLVERSFAGPINVGTGVAISIRAIAEKLSHILGKTGLVRFSDLPAPDPLGYVVGEVSKLRSLGWRPEMDLDEGLRRLAKHLSA
jgi:dTDP-6-deoxy-L-talose 4-dehydrogenase (NAD+)